MMKCPHCGGDLAAVETRSQRHYALLAKYADGQRSYEEIAALMNADPEFKDLWLQPRTAVNVRSGIRDARKHGHRGAKYQPRAYHYKYDKAAMVAAWRGGETQKSIAKRLGASQGRICRMIKDEIELQRKRAEADVVVGRDVVKLAMRRKGVHV